jgi:16S rRNA G966 N2-methylase RsmD
MNMLAAELPGASWLDLFCGSGVMGCEALQKGAAAVVAVDQDRRMQASTRSNLQAVARGLPQPVPVEVVAQEVLRWLQEARAKLGPAPSRDALRPMARD